MTKPDVLSIDALGPQGDGIHRSERGPVYVDRALPGDTVRATIYKGSGGVLRGDVHDIVTPSPHRVTAPCPHYDSCGGCTLQHADEAFYQRWKTDIVRAALYKKDLMPAVWHAPVFVPPGTRRRATFAAAKKKGGVTLGFFRRRSHQVADVSSCLILDPAIMGLRAKLAIGLGSLLQDGKDADAFIQTIDGQCEVVITGAVGKRGLPDLQVYEDVAQLAHTAGISRIAWRARERDAAEVLVEINPLRAKFGGLEVALPPLAFLQPTKMGEDALVAAVMEALPDTGTFADLFSGCGTFSGPMLAHGTVDAFENVESAVRALNAARGSKPLRAVQRDLFRNPLEAEEAARYNAIVFDPPRAGAQEQAKALAASDVRCVIGVSCDPASFARDARVLVDGGYVFDSMKVIDQFTWSHHVELVAVFSKKI